jgi:hypothetical protein
MMPRSMPSWRCIRRDAAKVADGISYAAPGRTGYLSALPNT